ncbi:MAG TPA: LPXTG cell wall anchor domain-containing protein [Acidimicrobiia bacterium]|nr:LPXTG cell wall anchor domain-containing protein [Acidimicrobiia bacterium]
MLVAVIRQAEQWNPGSVLAGLLLLGGALYWFWRQLRKP